MTMGIVETIFVLIVSTVTSLKVSEEYMQFVTLLVLNLLYIFPFLLGS